MKKKRENYTIEEDYWEDWDDKDRLRARKEERKRNRQIEKNGGKQNDQQAIRQKNQQAGRHEQNVQKEQKVRRKRKKKSGLRRLLLFIVLLISVALGGIYYGVGLVYSHLQYVELEDLKAEPLQADGVINILLIGNDSRENGTDGRSDAMILLSFNNKSDTIYMTSFLRDMYVEIPGHDGNRLNAAYAFGGPELLMQTIEKNFDIEVNDYVSVNFESFAKMVDAVGGIDLLLTTEEMEYVNGYLVEYNILTNQPQGTGNIEVKPDGVVHLNGPQALAYSRIRYLGTDFGRTERQRKVLEAVIKSAPKAAVTNPQALFEGLFSNMTTNLTKGECFRSVLYLGLMPKFSMEQSSIPLDGTYRDAKIRGMAVLEVDFETNKAYLRDTIYRTEKKETSARE